MKQLLGVTIMIAMVFTLANGQEVLFTFTPEGVQSATENTGLLLSDPTINRTTLFEPQGFKQEKMGAGGESESEGAGGFSGFTIGVETEVSKNTKSFSLPLNYYFSNFNIGVTLPYIYQRRMEYALETKESSGMGDVAVSVGYTGFFSSSMFNFNVYAKLPTGDDENSVDGYLVPLGTGSTDYVFSLGLMKNFGGFSVHGNGIYKMNGTSDKIAEVIQNQGVETINYEIQNGNMFSFTGGFDIALSYTWTLGLWGSFISVGEGTTDAKHSFDWGDPSYTQTGISNKQDMTLVDAIPNISYGLAGFDLSLFVKIPVVTERNQDNNEGDRGMTILFKLGRSL